MNIVSILIGLATLPFALVAFIPLFGWLYWFVLPFAVTGLAFGAVSRHRGGRTLNAIVILVAVVRLVIGHGIF